MIYTGSTVKGLNLLLKVDKCVSFPVQLANKVSVGILDSFCVSL